MEKPLGTSLATSQEINDQVGEYFEECQVYRIDHYLGKETVLNLLALRFANSLFVNNWDNRTIDHVEITVAEEVGIEGRWGYFDKARSDARYDPKPPAANSLHDCDVSAI